MSVRRAPATTVALLTLLAAVCWPQSARPLNPSHDCSFCHGVHAAPGASLTRDADVEVLCLSCHGPAGSSVLKADVHQDPGVFRVSCLACHDPHSDRANWLGPHDHDGTPVDGVDIRLVGRRGDAGVAVIDTLEWDASLGEYLPGLRNVVFEQRGRSVTGIEIHSFADADADGNGVYDGVCEVCHTLTKHHRNNPSGGHNHKTGDTCTECHGHDTGFLRR